MARAAATRTAERTPLSRKRALEAALKLVDADGLEALSMRRLGAELGVEAMSLYKHVANKDALLDGIVEQLWREVRDAIPGGDWAAQLRAFAHQVRATMHRHPQAASLLLSRCVLPVELLEIYATLLDTLRDAGFDDGTAARTVRSLGGYALGYVSTELYCLGAWRAEADHRPGQDSPAAATDAARTDVLLWLGRILPAGTPSRLVNAALTVLDCDPDGDFDAGLDLAIQGLHQLHEDAPTGTASR